MRVILICIKMGDIHASAQSRPDAIAALLSNNQPRTFAGPDLAWLLFEPDLMTGRTDDVAVLDGKIIQFSQ